MPDLRNLTKWSQDLLPPYTDLPPKPERRLGWLSGALNGLSLVASTHQGYPGHRLSRCPQDPQTGQRKTDTTPKSYYVRI